MQFQHGYYSGSGYTYGVYPEYFPSRLRLVALLRGHRPPSLEAPFQLVEFGCGQGLGVCLQAALHPHARFSGIDLLPAHISHAQALASDAGLSNASFQEADFLDLVQDDPDRCGLFDIAICHGVLSWVSREVQQAVWKLAVSSLRPGGLFALSYNSFPGNLAEVPFQHLVQSLQGRHAPGAESLEAAIGLFERLRACGSGLFQAQPSLVSFLDGLGGLDPQYLPHEYNQQRWQPRFSDRVIGHAADLGFTYLASATLAESFDGLLPEPFRPLLQEQHDPALRELLRDLLVNQSFRRDVYSRGLDPLWPQEAQRALLDQQLIRLVDDDQLEHGDLYRFPLSFGMVQGNQRWFTAFLASLGREPCRLGDLPVLSGANPMPLPELLQNLALLLGKGLVALVAPEVDPQPSQRLNLRLASKVRAGAPYTAVAAPRIGTALRLSQLELLCLDAWLQGERGAALAASLGTALRDLRGEVGREGRPIPAEALPDALASQAARFEQRTLPLLQRLAAVA